MTKSPEASKFMKNDADWISTLYKDWKAKHNDKKDKKAKLKLKEVKGKLEMIEKKKGQKLKLIKPKEVKTILTEKIEKITKK